ncbi:MAG: sulfatase [Planctomycetes bacterium]|nr:sulfatase [Planctomycetota bacterium]
MKILYLDLDTLRPDHLSCYGYHRKTSPNLDSICADGVRFDNYYCSDAPCLPSRTAMMSGQHGIHTGVVNHGGVQADMRPQGANRGFRFDLDFSSFPKVMQQSGLHTAYVGGFANRHSTYNYYCGFSEIHDTGMGGMESAEHVTPSALKWIKENAAEKDDWYLHVNYWDPHTPYRVPDEYGNPFENEPISDWYTQEKIDKDQHKAGPHSIQDIMMYDDDCPDVFASRHVGRIDNMQDMKKFIDGYDCGIHYMDSHIGQLIAAFKAAGVYDDLAIIVSADHAENMGELGIYGEHATADYVNCRIPMIVRWPEGGAKGHVDTGLHYNLDIAPTMAELLQYDEKDGVKGGLRTAAEKLWDGHSFAASIKEKADTGYEDIVISQGAHVCQRGVRWGPWLYMRTYHDGFHLFNKEMLFNIEEDPREENDLTESRPEIVHEGAWRLQRWFDNMMDTMPEGYVEDPLRVVIQEGGPLHARGQLRTYCERLEKTGRGEHIAELKRRHPREFTGSGEDELYGAK